MPRSAIRRVRAMLTFVEQTKTAISAGLFMKVPPCRIKDKQSTLTETYATINV
jgi:hypothetical protein